MLPVYYKSRPLGETRLTGPGDRSPSHRRGDGVSKKGLSSMRQIYSLAQNCPIFIALRSVLLPASATSLVLLLLLLLAFKIPAISLH